MRISRIQIENFRNFHSLDLYLARNAVIVGENKIGKTNLLYAIRLILDPSLPDSARQLREEDFWDGLERPLKRSDKIKISIDFEEFDTNDKLLSLLGDHLINPEPMIARLTYVFQPLETLEGEPTKESDYEFILYGGDRPEIRLSSSIRRSLPLDVLPALRDAEGDIANWRRSPLRPLLDAASGRIRKDELTSLAANITAATLAVAQNNQLEALVNAINDRVKLMVGSSHAIETSLGFSPTDPERLFRTLRLFIDGGRREMGAASLGSANVLYLTLKALELSQAVEEGQRHHTFLAIEEPEAHLHPHLQRLVYRDFLHEPAEQEVVRPVSVLLTTHSPHIVSVTPLNSIVLLRKAEDGRSTESASTARLELPPAVVADLERYLDITRGEMLFAKGVILVEGDAEKFLVPAIAKANGYDFDKLGISVCSVAGTNFAPYLALLGSSGLRIPVSVITDGDPKPDGSKLGHERILKLLQAIVTEDAITGQTRNQQLAMAAERGLFTGNHTFEVDLFKSGAHDEISNTLDELAPGNAAARDRAQSWKENPSALDPQQFLKDINSISKGRFAQRLSTRIAYNHCPEYVMQGINYVSTRCR